MSKRVSVVTLGCARNDVDSDELAGRLESDGWTLTDDTDGADAVLVNTCGFVESAKKDSIDTILELSDGSKPVVAVGCLAQRYGRDLASELPEAAAVLGFDTYDRIGTSLDQILAGESIESHEPGDRRKLLPITPVDRHDVDVATPGHEGHRVRLGSGPTESLKIASGCDRRCTFCAIPSFRGSFVSRRPSDVLDEARWLVNEGVRELLLVSENSTSYGKDLGDLRLLETMVTELGALHPEVRVRPSYLQPAEMRPDLVSIIGDTPGVAAYFDMSFQHASPTVLRRMKRFGGSEDFLALVAQIRQANPQAGIRTNVIVGFPGETDEEFEELLNFISEAELDAVGIFGYSDEDGTAALELDDKVPDDVIAARVEEAVSLVDVVSEGRAASRVGETVEVLIEEVDADLGVAVGRAEHQGPEDGSVTISLPEDLVQRLTNATNPLVDVDEVGVGKIIRAEVRSNEGVDLFAKLLSDEQFGAAH